MLQCNIFLLFIICWAGTASTTMCLVYCHTRPGLQGTKIAEKVGEEVIYRQFLRGEKKKKVLIPANRNKPYSSGLDCTYHMSMCQRGQSFQREILTRSEKSTLLPHLLLAELLLCPLPGPQTELQTELSVPVVRRFFLLSGLLEDPKKSEPNSSGWAI